MSRAVWYGRGVHDAVGDVYERPRCWDAAALAAGEAAYAVYVQARMRAVVRVRRLIAVTRPLKDAPTEWEWLTGGRRVRVEVVSRPPCAPCATAPEGATTQTAQGEPSE